MSCPINDQFIQGQPDRLCINYQVQPSVGIFHHWIDSDITSFFKSVKYIEYIQILIKSKTIGMMRALIQLQI